MTSKSNEARETKLVKCSPPTPTVRMILQFLEMCAESPRDPFSCILEARRKVNEKVFFSPLYFEAVKVNTHAKRL